MRKKEIESRLMSLDKYVGFLAGDFDKFYAKTEELIDKLTEKVKKLEIGLLSTDNLADKNGKFVRFLATTNKDDVKVCINDIGWSCYTIEYIIDGEMHYKFVDKQRFENLTFDMVIKNEKDYAILSFKNKTNGELKYYKLDKMANNFVEITEFINNEKQIELIDKVTNVANTLADLLTEEPKKAKVEKKTNKAKKECK